MLMFADDLKLFIVPPTVKLYKIALINLLPMICADNNIIIIYYLFININIICNTMSSHKYHSIAIFFPITILFHTSCTRYTN